ncbi:MAG: hypothetical protein ACK54K_05375, partial [Gemmatimonadaceae bacterium]
PMDLDRDTVASALVGTGGVWLLGTAALQAQSGKWNRTQQKGLIYSGAGFLLSAAASHFLRDMGPRGVGISLVGTLFAMRGMYLLVRERAAARTARGGAGAPRPPE